MRHVWKVSVVIFCLLAVCGGAWSQDDSEILNIGTQSLAVAIRGHYAYIGGCDSTLAVVDISDPAVPVLVGRFATPGDAEGIAFSGNYAYVADYTYGLRVFNISNPYVPTQVGVFDTPGYAHGVTVVGNLAYIADWHGGVRVVNVSNPSLPANVSYYDTPDRSRSLVISGNYAYVADGNSGMRILNISNPSSLTEVGSINSPETTMDVVVNGSYAYLATRFSGLRIINIANPAAPTLVGFYDTPGDAVDVVLSGEYAYVADGPGGLRIINVSNPTSPTQIGYIAIPGLAYGVAVNGSFAYVVYSATNRGLRIINISNPASLSVVGFLETGLCDALLPVELIAFTATPGNSRVTLNWRTGSEQDNARFEIARDGEVVAIKESQGNSASEQQYAWTDDEVMNGRVYRYTLTSISTTGEREELQSVEAIPAADAASLVTEYALHGAYPNPFNPTTTIGYDLAQAGQVTLAVYNLMGQHVATLVNGTETGGRHSVAFDATGLPSGMYVYRLEANGFSAMQKMVLLK